MQTISKNQDGHHAMGEETLQKLNLRHAIDQAWQQIAPHWPLQNFVASNPLQGLELLPFETACEIAANQYQQAEIPERLKVVNIETIKWSLAFFDRGQATFQMPDRQLGLLNSWLELAVHDSHLHQHRAEKKAWLGSLSRDPEVCIASCLEKLEIPPQHYTQFMTLMLTTLSGWAGHVKYCVEWTASHAKRIAHPVSLDDYLAMRLIITTLLWKEAAIFLKEFVSTKQLPNSSLKNWLCELNANEEEYAHQFLGLLTDQAKQENTLINQTPKAQIVFCIDVRSETFRQALEAQGNYETLGFAGFFGVPVEIKEYHTGKTAASCPVLISPKHTVIEIPDCTIEECERDKIRESTLRILKQCYHGMKYTFSTHFALVEAVGPWAGLWMMLKTLFPIRASFIKKLILRIARPPVNTAPYIHGLSGLEEQSDLITYKDQCQYAHNALRMMGFTKFAPVVVLCGHGASTENNAYASALDCGACGGRHGGVNAQILAKILNNTDVRRYLNTEGIIIPQSTRFISALHNTTTDKVSLDLPPESSSDVKIILDELQSALIAAQKINTARRCANFEGSSHGNNVIKQAVLRSVDWAQTRPEWGLARNASFVVGPRWLTKNLDCQGRTFLHSYEWEIDQDGSLLTTILTAPMIVAQWINNQYLFSTFDNVAYGSGSKVTQNVAGKVGVMQGNASDLMHGLPLQSVYSNDTTQYHEPLRLLTVVYAPCDIITEIIRRQPILQKLFGNGWVKLSAIDPIEKKCYLLGRDFQWNLIE